MPEVVSPEKLGPRRFTSKRTPETPFASSLTRYKDRRPETTLPGHPAVRRVAAAAPTAVLIRNSNPLGGTESTIRCRLLGALGVLAAARPLSTGVLRKAAEMIYISRFRARQ
ncbi:hypothetical protein OG365_40525 (plasmid) [Streptomyces sp. NBC_00853]|uniref:hypothetical protein n=1 Tax=Streptomyces sp. NBC_00853 TaxID=2903681 RepID=UPI002F90CFF4|nr:hypothetical protein OG365_40525 [Streptomyces sp. NBC_00853]